MKVPILDPGTYRQGPAKVGGADAEKAAGDFEAYFIQNLLKELKKFSEVKEKGFMEDTYQSIVNEKVADFLAKKGIGIKELLLRHLEKK